MNEHSCPHERIDRLQGDLDTIRSALGNGLPFSRADIRFCWSIAGSLVFFLIMLSLGFDRGKILLASSAPVLIAVVSYFSYMAARSRNRATTSPQVRNDYRLAIIMSGLLIIGIPLSKKWASSQGLDLRTFDSVTVLMIGMATFAMSFLPFSTARLFRRLSIGVSGAGLITIGLLMPMYDRTSLMAITAIILLPVITGQALLMHYFLRRENSGLPIPA